VWPRTRALALAGIDGSALIRVFAEHSGDMTIPTCAVTRMVDLADPPQSPAQISN
jgi:hypothetical protein